MERNSQGGKVCKKCKQKIKSSVLYSNVLNSNKHRYVVVRIYKHIGIYNIVRYDKVSVKQTKTTHIHTYYN